MSTRPLSRTVLLLAAMASAVPALAQPGWGGRWGGGWGHSRLDAGSSRLQNGSRDEENREGRVQVEQFSADDAADRLGQGAISVTAQAAAPGDASDTAPYEAAVIDQLVKMGYDTMAPDAQGGQVAEIRIVRDVLVPQEPKRKPVSGEVTVGASSYGTFTGMAIGVDLTKPKKALISTRLEARVKDRETGAALWEGRAVIATREGDDRWGEQAIATRLAEALFAQLRESGSRKVASR